MEIQSYHRRKFYVEKNNHGSYLHCVREIFWTGLKVYQNSQLFSDIKCNYYVSIYLDEKNEIMNAFDQLFHLNRLWSGIDKGSASICLTLKKLRY